MGEQCYLNTSAGSYSYAVEASQQYYIIVSKSILYAAVGLSVIGFIGNTVSVIVLKSKDMASTGTMLLVYLAVVDNIVLIMNNLYTILLRNINFYLVYIALSPFLDRILEIVNIAELYLTLALLFQRVVAVVYPLKHKAWITRKRNKFLLTAIVIFAVICFVPQIIANPPEVYFEPTLNRTWIRPGTTSFYETNCYRIVYTIGFLSVIRLIIPILFILISSVLIIRGILRAHPPSNVAYRKNKKQKLTIITLAISGMTLIVVIFVCLSYAIMKSEIIIFDFFTCNEIATCLHFLTCLNSSINWLFYSLCGSKFRKTLSKRLRCQQRDYVSS